MTKHLTFDESASLRASWAAYVERTACTPPVKNEEPHRVPPVGSGLGEGTISRSNPLKNPGTVRSGLFGAVRAVDRVEMHVGCAAALARASALNFGQPLVVLGVAHLDDSVAVELGDLIQAYLTVRGLS